MLVKKSLTTTKTMKNKKSTLVKALGNAARVVYLTDNPHGFCAVKKVHKSKKAYNRKKFKFTY